MNANTTITLPTGATHRGNWALPVSLPESIMDTCSVVLTFESVNEILWCDHSNKTSSAVRLHGTISLSIFYKTKFGIFLEF